MFIRIDSPQGLSQRAGRPSARGPRRLALLLFVLLSVLVATPQALADAGRLAGSVPADTRAQEIAECRPGELRTWGDGVDHAVSRHALQFHYRHAGAPAWFTPQQVREALQRAARVWAGCGIGAALVDPAPGSVPDEWTIAVSWDDAGSAGNFGLARVGERRLVLGPAAFGLLRQRNPAYPALQTLQMVISHEMGHFFGLMAHSRRCVDVMSYYTDGRGGRCSVRDPAAMAGVPEYRSVLPTACDIERCRRLNAQPQ